jgi:hypothetical protein
MVVGPGPSEQQLRRMAAASPAGTPSDAEVAAISVDINARLRRLDNVLLPPAIRLEVTEEQPRAGGGLNFGQLFLPGILFMSILFIAQGMSMDVWEGSVLLGRIV